MHNLCLSEGHRLYQCTVRAAAVASPLPDAAKMRRMERQKGDTTRKFDHRCARTYPHRPAKPKYRQHKQHIGLNAVNTRLYLPPPPSDGATAKLCKPV